MSIPNSERELVRAARELLDDWLFEARDEAYADFFEGEDPVLTEAELGELDHLDSVLSRQDAEGLWGVDRYGIVPGSSLGRVKPRVVCIYHPEIPGEGYQGVESLAESTREQYNDVLWQYAERVAELLQDRLDAYFEAGGMPTEE